MTVLCIIIIIIIIISSYIKVRPKASGAGLVCRTDQYFQCQRLTYTCRIKTVYDLSEKVWNFRFGTWRGRETGRADIS